MTNNKLLKNAEIVGIIPVRLGSSRLPNKALLPLENKPVLQHIIDRIKNVVDDFIIATTTLEQDSKIVKFCQDKNYKCMRGENENVIQRIINASLIYEKDIIIIDISHDCPLVDPKHISDMINILKKENLHYVSNVVERSWPDGFDVQVYKRSTLIKAQKLITNPIHYLHAGWNILNYSQNKSKIKFYPAPDAYRYPKWGLCLDTVEDYELLKIIFKYFKNRSDFSAKAIINFLKANPELLEINKNVRRNLPGEG